MIFSQAAAMASAVSCADAYWRKSLGQFIFRNRVVLEDAGMRGSIAAFGWL